jgi:Tfp pilus assembly protein PilN
VIRTNLSTRPFYNERAIHALAALVAVIVVALTAWQVRNVIRLSQYKTELNTSIQKHKAETEVREREAAQVRSGIDQKELAVVAARAKEANELIEQRTFSWTQLFNHLEATLPDDVMLMAVRPEFKDGETTINMDLQGRKSDDINAFWDRLEKTGAFHNVLWSNVTITDDGLNRMQMHATYTPAQPSAQPAGIKPSTPAARSAQPPAAKSPAPKKEPE